MRNIVFALVITLTLSFSATFDEAEIEYQKGNFDKAFSLFEKLSIQGNSMAQQRFGTMYYMGRRVKKDYEKSAFSDSPECYHDWRKDSYQVSAAVDSNLIKKFRTVDRYFNNMYITEL